jgi:hypothetical protein
MILFLPEGAAGVPEQYLDAFAAAAEKENPCTLLCG